MTLHELPRLTMRKQRRSLPLRRLPLLRLPLRRLPLRRA
jgi:hypothetical protein